MKMIARQMKIDLPQEQSAFLWGPRKTGKSTYLKHAFPDSLVFDFLKTDLLLSFSRQPSRLREQLSTRSDDELRHPVILDEVQKVPQLLDEVHWLIETKGLSFILCGSSARKLKRGQANLLGGRAWRFELFPLTSQEIPNLDLLKALNDGLIPQHYLSLQAKRSLRAYVEDYLKEEVFDEGLTRNIPAFSRFFEALGYSHAELVNYANFSRECGVDGKTVKEYFQILVDTLLGSYVYPFKKRQSRQVISRAPKFYLFDVGVAGAITGRRVPEERGEFFGRALEHFVYMELRAHSSYRELDYEITFWRTKTGVEVDFVLGPGEVAIEVKGTSSISSRDLRPMRVFIEEFSPQKALIVCNEKEERLVDGIHIMPWRLFLEKLWKGEIIS